MTQTILKRPLSQLGALIALTGLLGTSAPAMAQTILSGPSVSGPTYQSVSYTPNAPISQTYTVGLNKTEIVRLPSPASAILVGNPSIADISIHSADTIFVVGRSYGETNMLILDTAGNTILNADIQVNNVLPRNGLRVYYGGSDRETYSCTPYCAAAPVLGDTTGFIGANSAAGAPIDNTIALGSTSSNTVIDAPSQAAAVDDVSSGTPQ